MDLLAFLTGLVTGLAFVGLLLQRLHAARARVNAARALARDAQTELVVVRERNAPELGALRAELESAEHAHAGEVDVLRRRFAIEVGELRRAVRDARAEADRAANIEQLVARVTSSVERVERELRRMDRGRSAKRTRPVPAVRR
ncbi:MAG TPA: hypothetical protein VLA98_05625 [Solirubrobacteraceae bacterium]|nr:hypothetical protein [Solirubrobacteraceae bacterium]